jgi:4'-phosphopantetheinyl transferase
MGNSHPVITHPEAVPFPVTGVDVWRTPSSVADGDLDQLAPLFPLDEFQTNIKFSRYPGVRRSLPRWALVRILLGRYLDVEPAQVRLKYGVFGKPYVDCNSVYFNLAHSREHVIVAIAACQRVGVDVEEVSQAREIDALAQRILNQRERDQLSGLRPAQQREMFFRYWVRKEALLKGIGTGLSTPMNRVGVSDSSLGNQLTITVPTILDRPAEWRIYDLDIPGEDMNSVAAVAVESTPIQTRPH